MKPKHKKMLAKSLEDYVYQKNNQDQCMGFIAGFESAIEVSQRRIMQQRKLFWCLILVINLLTIALFFNQVKISQ